VEDNKGDVFLIREAMETAHLNVDLHFAQDGEKALRFFQEVDRDDSLPVPALVIIDINLPKKHGGEVLEGMRNTRRCAHALVLVVTSSDSAQDRETMATLGANGYFRKPSQYEEFMKLGQIVKILLGEVPEAPC
jgi:two-component system, chemotaxis family, response regulator Rcp1